MASKVQADILTYLESLPVGVSVNPSDLAAAIGSTENKIRPSVQALLKQAKVTALPNGQIKIQRVIATQAAIPIQANENLHNVSKPPLGAISYLLNVIEKVPVVKYALGVSGIAAAIAIIRTFVNDLRIAAFGVVVMLVLMVVLLIVAKLAAMAEGAFKYAALTFLWFSLIITIASSSLLFSSVFFDRPLSLKRLIDPPQLTLPDSLRIDLNVQRFDLVSQKIGSPTVLDPILIKLKDVESNTASIVATKLMQTMRPIGLEERATVLLTIADNKLMSPVKLMARPHDRYQNPGQNQHALVKFGVSEGLDLDEMFRVTASTNPRTMPNKNHVSITLIDDESLYETQELVVYQSMSKDAKYSFQELHTKIEMNWNRKIRSPRVLIEDPIVVNGEPHMGLASEYVSKLKRELQAQDRVEVTGLTTEDLEKKRNELSQHPFYGGKISLTESLSIEYVVSTKFTLTRDPNGIEDEF